MDTFRQYNMGRPRLDINKPKPCTKCKVEYPADQFYLVTGREGRQIRRSRCKACEKAKALDAWNSIPRTERQAIVRRKTLANKGATPEWFEATLAAQGGGCAICGETSAKLCIDHDHSCCPGQWSCGKCNRGILCNNCNSILGFVSDDWQRLEAATEYLKGHR